MVATQTVESRRALWLCVGLAAVVRLAYWATKIGDDLLLNDSWYYSGQARQLTQGIWFREILADQPGAEHGPLTSLLMWPFSYGTEYQTVQRLVTVATGVALVWVLGRFTEQLAGRTAGIAAALIAALYPNLWMNDGLVMSESISTLLVALSLWAAWKAAQLDDVKAFRRQAVVLGVLLGLAVLARSELVLFVPLVLVWLVLVRRRHALPWRGAVLGLVIAVAVVSPWVGFNLTRFERPVFLTTNDGTTLLGANCPQVYSGPILGGWVVDCVTADPLYFLEEEPSVRSARQRSLGVHYALDHVGAWPKVVAARVARSVDLFGLDQLVAQDVGEERPRWASWAGIGAFWMMAVLSVFGALRLPRRDRSLLLVPVVVALVTTVLFYGAHRIRSSAEPSIVIFSAVAVASLWSTRWSMRWSARRSSGGSAA
jgi:4-amino-4-deoxy-L-arabinose transferase-like glycosyltransferase